MTRNVKSLSILSALFVHPAVAFDVGSPNLSFTISEDLSGRARAVAAYQKGIESLQSYDLTDRIVCEYIKDSREAGADSVLCDEYDICIDFPIRQSPKTPREDGGIGSQKTQSRRHSRSESKDVSEQNKKSSSRKEKTVETVKKITPEEICSTSHAELELVRAVLRKQFLADANALAEIMQVEIMYQTYPNVFTVPAGAALLAKDKFASWIDDMSARGNSAFHKRRSNNRSRTCASSGQCGKPIFKPVDTLSHEGKEVYEHVLELLNQGDDYML